jgi:hypothetical protein
MKIRNFLLSGIMSGLLVCAGAALAQAPTLNIDPHRHGNLAEAQQRIMQAYQKIDEAQRDNKNELGGHAEKAKQLLSDADRELKAAAEYADHRK